MKRKLQKLWEFWTEANFWEKNVYIFSFFTMSIIIFWVVGLAVLYPLHIILILMFCWFLFCVSKIDFY